MLNSFARVAGFLAYLFIALEVLFMVTPFALYSTHEGTPGYRLARPSPGLRVAPLKLAHQGRQCSHGLARATCTDLKWPCYNSITGQGQMLWSGCLGSVWKLV